MAKEQREVAHWWSPPQCEQKATVQVLHEYKDKSSIFGYNHNTAMPKVQLCNVFSQTQGIKLEAITMLKPYGKNKYQWNHTFYNSGDTFQKAEN